ncbi:ECF-type sigma factor [Novipirellula sp. SH528]|uniref:ECF-type sigma factor n=1 Tax=Novipirellula sp. SH528 TaxID=3454466 RepID=UPI003FA01865
MNDELQQPSESVVLMDYLPKLMRLAERNMSTRLKSKVGSDDMAGSIIGSVIRMSREGKIHIEQSDDFWRFLVAISLNKVRKKARYFNAQKRNVSRELQIGGDWPTLEELARSSGDPTEEDGQAMSEILEVLTDRLDDDCKTVLAGKLEGKGNLDIAAMLGPAGKSTKTVTRCWKKIEVEMKTIAEERGLL